jgi:hypothetical protein
MNLQEYIATKKTPKKVNAEAEERWQGRIVANGWDQQGEDGAQQYLSVYGKSIGAPKCINLAFAALAHGCPEVADGFFKKAAQLEKVDLSDVGNPQ